MKNLISLFTLCFFLFAGQVGKAQEYLDYIGFDDGGIVMLRTFCSKDEAYWSPDKITNFKYKKSTGTKVNLYVIKKTNLPNNQGWAWAVSYKDPFTLDIIKGTITIASPKGNFVKWDNESEILKLGQSKIFEDAQGKGRVYVAIYSAKDVDFYVSDKEIAGGNQQQWHLAQGVVFDMDKLSKNSLNNQYTSYKISFEPNKKISWLLTNNDEIIKIDDNYIEKTYTILKE